MHKESWISQNQTSPVSSWELFNGDFIGLSCGECARKFAEERGLDTKNNTPGMYLMETKEGDTYISAGECYACGHEFDCPPSCEFCGAYLKGYLTEEGQRYLIESLEELPSFPEWLLTYYLGADYTKLQEGNK